MSSIPDAVKLPFVFEGMWFFEDIPEMFDLFARIQELLSPTPSYLYDFVLSGRLVCVHCKFSYLYRHHYRHRLRPDSALGGFEDTFLNQPSSAISSFGILKWHQVKKSALLSLRVCPIYIGVITGQLLLNQRPLIYIQFDLNISGQELPTSLLMTR